MALTPEEEADVKAALKPFKLSIKVSFFLLIMLVIISPIMARDTGNAFFVNLLLVPIVSPPFIFGLCLYHLNTRRISESKTSISIGKSTKYGDYNHRFNQAGNIFYMIAGATIVVGVLFADIQG